MRKIIILMQIMWKVHKLNKQSLMKFRKLECGLIKIRLSIQDGKIPSAVADTLRANLTQALTSLRIMQRKLEAQTLRELG